jgi:hypothetical protein
MSRIYDEMRTTPRSREGIFKARSEVIASLSLEGRAWANPKTAKIVTHERPKEVSLRSWRVPRPTLTYVHNHAFYFDSAGGLLVQMLLLISPQFARNGKGQLTYEILKPRSSRLLVHVPEVDFLAGHMDGTGVNMP